ncbi:MAG: type III-B CRISPR module-associated protein Cmr3 [Anaerolineae bacterium]|jgi:CRISPR-associated protein Cmr3
MQLFLEPVDVWLFRDGRPFNAGSDHRARSLFPPYPSVLQGAIRSHELVLKGVDLGCANAIAQAVGTAEDYGRLRMRGPLIARRNGNGLQRYFPVPADVRVLADETTEPLRVGTLPPGVVAGSRHRLPRLLFSQGQAEKEGRGRWLSEADLEKALAGEAVTALTDRELYALEPRIGIERDSTTRATVPEMLYEVEYVQPAEGVGLWVDVQGYEGWPAEGYMRIGGEGRAAHFRQTAALAWPGLDPTERLPDRFRVYFAAPAYFQEGWRPADWERFFQGQVRLEAAALTGYETIGGYDWAQGKQKASRRFVPAGSVYYFSAPGPAWLRPDLTNQAITEWGGEIGFGRVIVVEWRD